MFVASMPSRTIQPDDPRLVYSGYVQKQVDASHAAFRRRYASDLEDFYDAADQSPGATIQWRTNAQRVTAVMQYLGDGNQCSEC